MEEFISSVPSADALAGFAVIRKPGTERYRHCRQTFMAMGLVASALAGGDRHLLVFPAKVLKNLTENINSNHLLKKSIKKAFNRMRKCSKKTTKINQKSRGLHA